MRRAVIAAAVVGGLITALLFVVPTIVDHQLNTVLPGKLPAVSEDGRKLHALLNVADMHADPLLWNRDLLARISNGHVDIPRLIEGNVALQVFSAPTQVPTGLNYEANELRHDMVTALAIFQGWPRATWSSPLARAVNMADRLNDTASRSGGKFRVLTSGPEIDQYLVERHRNPLMTAGVLSIEGMQAMEGKLENLDVLYQAGFRMMGLTHFFDNDLSGSAHGMTKGGLSDLGRQAVQRMEKLGIVVDVAHVAPKAVDDVLAMATRPVVVSHGGVKGTCDNVRNLSDEHLRGIARTRGVVGIGYWDAAICGTTADDVVKAILYAVTVIGPDFVGLGSDFDGATHEPFDTSALAVITDGLLRAGMKEQDIRKVMGENVLRVLREGMKGE